MAQPSDILPYSTGLLTAGVGGTMALNLELVSSVVGIIAAGAGIVLTVATIYWRWKEHKRRMKK